VRPIRVTRLYLLPILLAGAARAASAEAVSDPELSRLVEEDPALAERLAASAFDAATTAAARAKVLDLRGQALMRLDRHEEAAETFQSALALDDGTSRIEWRSAKGDLAWFAAIDPGVGRQERAARALLAAGRPDPARAILAHAMAAGARGAAADAWARTGGGTPIGLDPSPSKLVASTWYPPLPEIDLRLLDGGTLPLSSARGKVLLLDFWASWCAPCIHELPHVNALANELRSSGLAVITINARESAAAARSAAKALALDLPIASYDDSVDRAFGVRSLPTIILADREGRIRRRWDSYVPNFDAEVAAKIRALLVEEPSAQQRLIAEVQAGGGLLEVRWTRELASPIVGLAVMDDRESGRRIAAASGDQLLLVRPDGSVAARRKLPVASAGRLRWTSPSGPALYDAVTFRPGRPEVTWIDTRTGATHGWSASSPLLDVAVLPPSPPEAPRTRLVLATIAGISVAGPDGPETAWAEGAGETRAVAVGRNGGTPGVVALATGGALRRFDASGKKQIEVQVPPGSRGIVLSDAAAAGFGVLPSSARAAARGRFLPGGREQVVAASEAGQLVLVEVSTGSVVFRARWPGIDEIVAGDIDADGVDEIVVAAGKTLTVLGARTAERSSPTGPPTPARTAGS
jgi:thiol-disulfide isomerase/thioredoxin